MDIEANAQELQQAADYVVMQKQYISTGIGAAASGACLVAMAFLGKSGTWYTMLLVFFGVLLSGIGAWMLVRPKPAALLFSASVLFVGGGWLVLTFLIAQFVRGMAKQPIGFFDIVVMGAGVGTIVAATVYFKLYRRYRDCDLSRPSPAYSDWVRQELKVLERSSAKGFLDIIEFTEELDPWKAQLLPDGIFLSRVTGAEVLVFAREAVRADWQDDGKRTVGVELGLGDRVILCRMRTEQAQRLSNWIATGRPAPEQQSAST